MRSRRAGAGWIVAFAAAYAAGLLLVASTRVTVQGNGGRTWDVRVRQILRLADGGVRTQAPPAHALYIGALVCFLAGAPLAAWSLARVRDASDLEPAEIPGAPAAEPVDLSTSGLRAAAWSAGVAALCAWAVAAVTPATVASTFTTERGPVTIANGFATGAHPLHVARAEALRRHAGAGGTLEWVAGHQGGYPIESIAPGLAWVELAVDAVTFGRVPMTYAHTLVTVAVLLVPLAGFVALRRVDGSPPAVPSAAMVLHLVLPGAALSGGYRTLVDLGRVDEAAAAACVPLFMVAFGRAIATGTASQVMAAALSAAAALWLAAESAAALAACAAAAALTSRIGQPNRISSGRSAAVARVVASVLLCTAPLWIPLVGSHDLYTAPPAAFATVGAYVYASVEAVTPPIFLLALAGTAAAFHMRWSGAITTAVAVAALAALTVLDTFGVLRIYAGATGIMGAQRLLVLYLAGVGCHAVARYMARAAGARSPRAADRWHVAALAVLAFVFIGPLPRDDGKTAGLFEPSTLADQHVGDLAAALDAAWSAAGPNAAVLVVGPIEPTSLDLSLWASVLRPGLYFYKDPQWHWRKAAPAPLETTWDPRAGAAVPRLLSSAELSLRGIAAVVVAGSARRLPADASATLVRVRAGTDYDTYKARDDSRVVEWTGEIDAVEISDHAIRATGRAAGGFVRVRRNWHPRWRATVGGREAPVSETSDGFMQVEVGPGPLDLSLRYAAASRWPGTAMAAAGVLLVALPSLRRRRNAGGAR